MEEKVLGLTSRMGMEDRVIYSSFYHQSLVTLKKLNPSVKTGLLYSDGWLDAAAYAKNMAGTDALHRALYHMQDPGLKAPMICMNGAAVYDCHGRAISENRLLDSQVKAIMGCCGGEDIIFDFMTDRGSHTTAGEDQFRACFERNVLLPMPQPRRERLCPPMRPPEGWPFMRLWP